MENKQTAVDWFINNLPERFKNAIINTCQKEITNAKQMETEKMKAEYLEGYGVGYNRAINNIEFDIAKRKEDLQKKEFGIKLNN